MFRRRAERPNATSREFPPTRSRRSISGRGARPFSAALCRRVRDDDGDARAVALFDPAMKRLCVGVDLLDVSGAALRARRRASASSNTPFASQNRQIEDADVVSGFPARRVLQMTYSRYAYGNTTR